MTIRLTKNELRDQQHRLSQLEKYLPTLQLKKAMLQAEVYEAKLEVDAKQTTFDTQQSACQQFETLLGTHLALDLNTIALVTAVDKRYENIAGVEIPHFEGIHFQPITYTLFDTPPWVDGSVHEMRKLGEEQARLQIAQEKRTALERELREVSIRVNLFEKVLIPRCLSNIKKIKVFLGDQELAAVSQAKVAKTKIEERKKR